jgi:hypothetical protein
MEPAAEWREHPETEATVAQNYMPQWSPPSIGGSIPWLRVRVMLFRVLQWRPP